MLINVSGHPCPQVDVDGNDVDAVFEVAKEAVERARAGGGPTLIECLTYRHKGHSKSDKNLYRTKEEIEYWKTKDPVGIFETKVIESGQLTAEEVEQTADEVERSAGEVEQSARIVEQCLSILEDWDGEKEIQSKVPRSVKPPEDTENYTAVEGAKGELGIHIVSDGTEKPHRFKIRSPCFSNLSVFSELAEGEYLADMIATLGSLDLVFGEVDR